MRLTVFPAISARAWARSAKTPMRRSATESRTFNNGDRAVWSIIICPRFECLLEIFGIAPRGQSRMENVAVARLRTQFLQSSSPLFPVASSQGSKMEISGRRSPPRLSLRFRTQFLMPRLPANAGGIFDFPGDPRLAVSSFLSYPAQKAPSSDLPVARSQL